MPSTKALWQASKDVYYQRSGDEHVLIRLPGETYFTLNAMAGRIWLLIQDPLSLDDICHILMDEFQVEAQTCRMQTESLLLELEARKLASRSMSKP